MEMIFWHFEACDPTHTYGYIHFFLLKLKGISFQKTDSSYLIRWQNKKGPTIISFSNKNE